MKRLDKLLSEAGAASRSELKTILKAGRVTVDGAVVLKGETKVAEDAQIRLDGVLVRTGPVYLLLHKPAGVVSSTDDPRDPTVLDILPPPWKGRALFPVGRLDKETEGLLVITDDGALAHRLTAPKYAVEKTYYARIDGTVDQADADAFASGLTLGDGTVCRPASLEALGPGECRVVVREGKYHQVRRMLAARGKPVTYLRREREGCLTLDGLPTGQVRELTAEEVAALLQEGTASV